MNGDQGWFCGPNFITLPFQSKVPILGWPINPIIMSSFMLIIRYTIIIKTRWEAPVFCPTPDGSPWKKRSLRPWFIAQQGPSPSPDLTAGGLRKARLMAEGWEAFAFFQRVDAEWMQQPWDIMWIMGLFDTFTLHFFTYEDARMLAH